MRSYKKPLIVLLAVFLLPVLLSGALLVLVWLDKDHEQLKTQLQSWFKQQTQHELLIAGPLDIGFYPSFHVSAAQVSITDNAQQKLLELEKLLVEVDPFSVFENLLIEKVVIEKASLKLVKTKSGNIIFIQQQPDNKTSAGKEKKLFFPFSNIEVVDSKIQLTDETNRKLANLTDVNASIVTVNKNLLVVNLEANFHGLSDTQIDLNIKGEFSIAESQNDIETGNIRLLSKAASLDATVKLKKHERGGRVLVSISKSNPGIFFEHLGMQSQINEKQIFEQLKGEIEIQQAEDATEVIFQTLSIDDTHLQGKLNISNEMLRLDVKIDELDLEPYLEFFSNFVSQDQTEETGKEFISSINIKRVKLLHGEIEQFSNYLHLKENNLFKTEGSLVVNQVNPGQLYNRYTAMLKIPDKLKLKFDDEKLNYLDGSMSYLYNDDELVLNDMKLKLDDTTINGSVSFKMPVKAVYADLSIGRLDLDRYLELISLVDADDKQTTAKTDLDLEDLLKRLEEVEGQGKVMIDIISYQGTLYKGIDIQFN